MGFAIAERPEVRVSRLDWVGWRWIGSIDCGIRWQRAERWLRLIELWVDNTKLGKILIKRMFGI